MYKMNIWNFGVNNISYIVFVGCGIICALIRIICALSQSYTTPLTFCMLCMFIDKTTWMSIFFYIVKFHAYWISLNSLPLSLHLTFNSYIFESFNCETHLIVFIWNFDWTIFYKLISVIPPMGKLRGPWSSQWDWFCGD